MPFYAMLASWVVIFSYAFTIPLQSESYLFMTRYTARVSLVLFICAFIASSLYRLWPNGLTRAWLKLRRTFGLCFFLNHLVHAVCFGLVFWEAQTWPDSIIVILGTVEYSVLVLMALTSNDSAVKWLGPKVWGSLHKMGVYLLWVFFFYTYWSKQAASTFAWYAMIILAACFVLRVVVRIKPKPLVAAFFAGLVVLSGCSQPFVQPSKYDFKQDIAWREAHLKELEGRAHPYVGESYLVVKAAFGEPDKVFNGDYGDADERWDYIVRFHRKRMGIENFYFRKGRLVRVDFF